MSRRKLIFPDFLAVLAELSRLESDGYTKSKNWNLTQISEHLTKAMNGSMHGFKTRYALPTRLLGRVVFPIVIRIGIPEGRKAPPSALPRQTANDDPAIIQTLRQTIAAFTQHRAAFHPHPFFGRLSISQWQKFHLLHAAHHLSFLEPK